MISWIDDCQFSIEGNQSSSLEVEQDVIKLFNVPAIIAIYIIQSDPRKGH